MKKRPAVVHYRIAHWTELFRLSFVLHPSSFVLKLSWTQYDESLSLLTAIFPEEPGLAGFIGAKDNGRGGDTWSYKLWKVPVKSHHQQTNIKLLTGRMPFLSPNQECQSTEGKTEYDESCQQIFQNSKVVMNLTISSLTFRSCLV